MSRCIYAVLLAIMVPTDNFVPPGLDRFWPPVAIQVIQDYDPSPPWKIRPRGLVVKFSHRLVGDSQPLWP